MIPGADREPAASRGAIVNRRSRSVSMSDAEQRTYNVMGMSCEHCSAAVTASVGELAGVSSVQVHLASGVLVVDGSGVDGEAVRAAVEAAGYGLAEHG